MKPISNAKLGSFILDCMTASMKAEAKARKLIRDIKTLVKDIDNLCKRPCSICGESGEAWTCDVCGKHYCADHIIRNEIAPDNFENICVNCLEKEAL